MGGLVSGISQKFSGSKFPQMVVFFPEKPDFGSQAYIVDLD